MLNLEMKPKSRDHMSRPFMWRPATCHKLVLSRVKALKHWNSGSRLSTCRPRVLLSVGVTASQPHHFLFPSTLFLHKSRWENTSLLLLDSPWCQSNPTLSTFKHFFFISTKPAEESYIRSADDSLSLWNLSHTFLLLNMHGLTVRHIHIHARAHQQHTHTPTHVQTQTHLSPLHNAKCFFSLFPHGNKRRWFDLSPALLEKKKKKD